MATINPLSETLACPRLVFQAKMFKAGSEGCGPGFVKTDSQDLHARFPGSNQGLMEISGNLNVGVTIDV